MLAKSAKVVYEILIRAVVIIVLALLALVLALLASIPYNACLNKGSIRDKD